MPDGFFTMVAIDQRESLSRIVGDVDLAPIKVDLAETFSPLASALLVDPHYGLAPIQQAGVLAEDRGLLIAIEDRPQARTEITPGWSVGRIKAAGADGVKLLVLYHPDDAENAAHQRALTRQVCEDCRRLGMPAVVEAVSYGTRSPGEKADVVVRSARDLVPLGVDLYKAEFPGSFEASRRLDEACAGVPWVVLSAGAPMEVFAVAVEVACRSGASGVLAGRALWQEAVCEEDPERRRERLRSESVANFKRIEQLVTAYARPWRPATA